MTCVVFLIKGQVEVKSDCIFKITSPQSMLGLALTGEFSETSAF